MFSSDPKLYTHTHATDRETKREHGRWYSRETWRTRRRPKSITTRVHINTPRVTRIIFSAGSSSNAVLFVVLLSDDGNSHKKFTSSRPADTYNVRFVCLHTRARSRLYNCRALWPFVGHAHITLYTYNIRSGRYIHGRRHNNNTHHRAHDTHSIILYSAV